MPIQSTTQKLRDLSPDGSTKFFLLADILGQIYPEGGVVRILDVGGGSRFFQQQLKTAHFDYELTVLDIIPKANDIEVPYIQADITDNDLADNSFDVVISTDVLEHIPESLKRKFVKECLRIAKDACIIAGPFMTDGVDHSEIIVNDFNKSLFGTGQDWLEEHLEMGKPTLEMFHDILKRLDIPFHHVGSQSLATWLLNTHTNLIDAKLGLDADLHRRSNQLYNSRYLEMNEFQSPTYRQFMIMYTDASKGKLVDIGRYTDRLANGDSIADYMSSVMKMYAERIGGLAERVATLERKNLSAVEDIGRLNKLRLEQERIIADQSRILEKLRPLLKVLHSRPIRGVRKLAGNAKHWHNK